MNAGAYDTLLFCPFCGERIAQHGLFYDLPGIEATLYEHVRDEHPIRWRISRRWRRAMRSSLARRGAPDASDREHVERLDVLNASVASVARMRSEFDRGPTEQT